MGIGYENYSLIEKACQVLGISRKHSIASITYFASEPCTGGEYFGPPFTFDYIFDVKLYEAFRDTLAKDKADLYFTFSPLKSKFDIGRLEREIDDQINHWFTNTDDIYKNWGASDALKERCRVSSDLDPHLKQRFHNQLAAQRRNVPAHRASL